MTPQPGRKYGIFRCVHYPTHRVMSRRRYGVSSDGRKFKRWSWLPEWGSEAFRLPKPGKVSGESNIGESAEDGAPSEGEPCREDSEEEDAEDKPAEEEAQERKEAQEEALGGNEVATNSQDSAGSAGGEAGEKEVPVGGPSQGKDQEDPAYVSASTPRSTSASSTAPAPAPVSTPDPTSGLAPDLALDSAQASAAAPAVASAPAAPSSASAMKITVPQGREKTARSRSTVQAVSWTCRGRSTRGAR